MPPPVDDHDAPQPLLPPNWPVAPTPPALWASALIEEVSVGHDINVNMLLKHGSAVNAYDGETLGCALIAAVENRQPRMVPLLLNQGAHIDYASRVDGDTALSVAIAHRDWPMAQFLLTLGAHPDFPDPMSQNTLLMVAIIEKDWTAAHLLLQYGANPDFAHPVTGETPWMLAQVLGHAALFSEMLSRLISRDPHPQDHSFHAHALTAPTTTATVQQRATNLPQAVDRADGDVAETCRAPAEHASDFTHGPAPQPAPVNGDSHAADDVSPLIATGLSPLHEP